MVGTGIREAQLVVSLSPSSPSIVTGMGIRNWSPEACSACGRLAEKKDLSDRFHPLGARNLDAISLGNVQVLGVQW